MIGADSPLTLGSLAVLMALGAVLAAVMRSSRGAPHYAACQAAFLLMFAVVGVSAAAATFLGNGWYCGAGTVLTLMTIAGVADMRPHRRLEMAEDCD